MAAGGKRPANTAPQEQPLAANQPAPAHPPPPPPQEEGLKLPPPGIEPVPPASNFPPEGPLGGADADEHPIAHLINEATQEFQEMRGRQSRNLEQAVEEYKRRYAMPPPPYFDVWFNLAQEKGVRIIDDYDTIYHSLLPFWGVKPATIRERAREVIAFKRMVVGVMIRDKKITKAQRADETKHWRAEALKKMIEPYVEYLPDMDLAINDNDEPRVVIPSDELSVLQQRGTQEVLKLAAEQNTQHEWSPRPEGLNPGDR
ncbi:capsule-associated protein CAP1, partial [Ascosphaera atra]